MSTSELNVPGIILDKDNHQWIDHPPIYLSTMEKLPSEVPRASERLGHFLSRAPHATATFELKNKGFRALI
jgi:hypothetical protein